MNIKNTVPSERNESQKTTYCMIPFLRNARIGKPMEIKRLLVLGWGKAGNTTWG